MHSESAAIRHLAMTQRQAVRWESFITRESSRCALIGGGCHGEAGGGLCRRRASYVIAVGTIFGFLRLVLRQKQGQK